MTSPEVTIIIVTHNAGAYLQRCVDCVGRQTFDQFVVRIVDNASVDGSVEALRLPDFRFEIVRLAENTGFAAANNHIALTVDSPWIVTLNPDTEPEPTWLAALVRAAGRHSGVAAVGSTQIRLDDPEILDGVGDVWFAGGLGWRALEGRPVSEAPADREIFGACAAGALYRTAVYQSLGGFDERFFCYCEDIDLAFRMRSRGWSCVSAADARLMHAGSGTTGKNSYFTLYHGHRNRIWTFVKNTPGLWFVLLAPVHVAMNLYFLARAVGPQRRAMGDGYLDAIKGLRPMLSDRAAERRERKSGPAAPVHAWTWNPALAKQRGMPVHARGNQGPADAVD